ncbi:hypothetical protein TSAR_005282 [Trichomalopsis sarcophagae]|uniref:Matrin-type domain-containing protein n=1 Tax=Trichomalopsis sarcophagae TaxID=543379 RepID=A0A232EF80_9HYME|nr:hypothetical protein TSAR_005282 [Trichomalopsis sarcophagae]
MPKYYCEYCDTYLANDSPTVRDTHRQGRKHKDNVTYYYQKWLEEKTQKMIDEVTAAFKAAKIVSDKNTTSSPLPSLNDARRNHKKRRRGRRGKRRCSSMGPDTGEE